MVLFYLMLPKGSNRFLLAIFLVFVGLVLVVLGGFLTPLILGILLASFTHHFYERLARRLNQHTNLAALLVVMLVTALIIIPFLGFTTLVAREAFGLLIQSQEEFTWDQPFGRAAKELLARFNVDLEQIIKDQIFPTFENIGEFLTRQIGNVLSNAFTLTLDFFILILTLFYLLRDGRSLGTFLMELSPFNDRESLHLYRTFRETGRAVFYGNFISAISQGFLAGIGFFLFGLPSPILWGSVVAFLALIPLLGAYLVFIPATLYLFLIGETLPAVGFLLFNILLVSSIDNIIKPKLISAKTKIHPLFAVLVIFGGIQLFGILGIIYGPLIAATFLSLFHIYKERVKPEFTDSGG